ncbi:ABC transporter ATP-binding protein [Roseibium sp.]|uniref:ABC transporter ATP-binding protein n=1 Tax=Roseibium sp. TaxID=1936156 RepID=UPI003B5007B5
MSEISLRTEDLSVGYRNRSVLENLTLDLPTGQSIAILGPNGCGKSTLLSALARLLAPLHGRVLLGDADINLANTRKLSRQLAILPQFPIAPEGIQVGELVKRGRTPWRGLLSPWSANDSEVCRQALLAVGMQELAERPLAELSGGQRQRAWLALVLAQNTPLLLLDEPTSFLDLPHQIDILKLLKDRCVNNGTTVISVLHDLNLAARFSDFIVLLGTNGLVTKGAPDKVIAPAHLKKAFGLEVRIMSDPVTNRPMVVPF